MAWWQAQIALLTTRLDTLTQVRVAYRTTTTATATATRPILTSPATSSHPNPPLTPCEQNNTFARPSVHRMHAPLAPLRRSLA